uniref:Uncharacterized protein n=1 Tax=Chromera velia CCMP2878 TaxID=1169474 RepID=A0A0G4F6Y1_9ALVE|eukprot:Cvel_15392.t1-p1 / transcript=Cvel_15392.t1 / gene=Cvel_15392 / organism=Chromera_velia_CCMP2878 / gene_product=hypothetical protein / transcript_product=hypothetical protein / location=Cvel_scaffold1136:39817-40556(+) / protein_length=141 / sequence_SO=supercontig / SO=protein_coding / is_pseudo=false
MDPTGGKASGKAVSCAVPNANDPESKDAKRIIEFLKEKENSVYIFERMQEDQVRGEYFLDAACLPHTRVSWQEFNAQSVPVPPVCSGDPASFDTMCSLLQASFKENGVNLRFVDGNRTQRLGTDINTALTMTREAHSVMDA